MRAKLKTGLVCVCCVGVMWVCVRLYQELLNAYEQSGSLADQEYSWFFRLLLNLAGYGLIMAPGFILYKYLQRINYFDKINSNTLLSRTLLLCYGEPDVVPEPNTAPPDQRRDALELMFCFTGLMGAYLVWGLLQEKIMTQTYSLSDGSSVRFTDAQFLVLVNRFVALIVGAAVLRAQRRALLVRPLQPFSYCALSNVLSAWCQYEALKYVSFPAQVLSKSCKVIPVMLMGKLVSDNTYETYEYITGLLLSAGMVIFLAGGGSGGNEVSWVGSGAGLALLGLYLCSDSFTASWQAALFVRSRCRPQQMLCAVNVFAVAFTAPALLRHDAPRLQLLQHGGFVCDVVILSLSSALGQLLIYRTISSFGAVVFTIIMTVRQAVSILLSCIVYGHKISWSGVGGVALVFVAVLLRLYCAQRRRAARGKRTAHT